MVDFIVVGSGATGSMAAQTLLEGGASVLMLDGGRRDGRYVSIIPDEPFVSLRRSDEEQHRYLLGESFESIAFSRTSTGAQLTPPRRYLVQDVERFLPLDSASFKPLESLALGGLAAGWGLASYVFSAPELRLASLPVDAMNDSYQVVASRVGLSGTSDDVQRYTFAHLKGVQSALPLDPTADVVYRAYQRRREAARRRGFVMGRPALAMLSRDRDSRRGASLNDMEYYADFDRAGWRAWMTIETLKKEPAFHYEPDRLVTHFEEHEDHVVVHCIDMTSLERRTYKARHFVLAAGALGSARIVLRSFGRPPVKLGLLCNPYTYIPCVVPSRIGREMPDQNIGLCQLALFHDRGFRHEDVGMAHVYSYRSLMLFRLLKDVPLGFRDSRILMQYLLSGLLVVGLHHPHRFADNSYVTLAADPGSITGDRLVANYELPAEEAARVRDRERRYMRLLRGLGAWPIKRVFPPYGSSIHYAGTLPYSDDERPFTTARDGRLHGTRRVYVADGSPFTFLPAKGLTLSLMAHAHMTARRLTTT